MKMGAEENDISLRQLIKRFRSKVSVTWLLVALEGLSLLLMPLVIGRAVDGLINGERTGLFQLGGLCLFLLIAGAGRRFYDTRIYGRIFRIVSAEIVRREATKKTTLSATSARVNLFSEFIEFLETTNYSITWIILTSVLIFSVLAVSSPEVSLGHVISIIMYVFGFLESVISFPLYYQQVVRLQEIGGRLE